MGFFMIQNADIIFYQCIHDCPKTGYVGPPSFDFPVFGNGPKTNRVARGHHGLPVSSKTPPRPQRRQPLRVHRGRIPISLASAAPGLARPCPFAGTPEVLEGVASPDRRGRAGARRRPVTQQHARETRACRRWPPQRSTPRRRKAVERGWKRGRAACSRKTGTRRPQSRRRGLVSVPELKPERPGRELVI